MGIQIKRKALRTASKRFRKQRRGKLRGVKKYKR